MPYLNSLVRRKSSRPLVAADRVKPVYPCSTRPEVPLGGGEMRSENGLAATPGVAPRSCIRLKASPVRPLRIDAGHRFNEAVANERFGRAEHRWGLLLGATHKRKRDAHLVVAASPLWMMSLRLGPG